MIGEEGDWDTRELAAGTGSTFHFTPFPLLGRVRAGRPITTCSGMTTASRRMSCKSSRTSCATRTCAALAPSPSRPRHTTPDWWHSERGITSWTRSTTGERAAPAGSRRAKPREEQWGTSALPSGPKGAESEQLCRSAHSYVLLGPGLGGNGNQGGLNPDPILSSSQTWRSIPGVFERYQPLWGTGITAVLGTVHT